MLIDSYALEGAVLRSDLPAKMLAGLEGHGVIGLALLGDNLRYPAGKRPVQGPADFKGLRIRSYPSATQWAALRTLGAKPSPEGWGQIPPAFLAGLFLARFVVRTGSLLPALLAHVLSNGWVVLAPVVFPWEIPGYSAVVEGQPFQPPWLDLLGVALLLTGAAYFHRLCPPRSPEPESEPDTEGDPAALEAPAE